MTLPSNYQWLMNLGDLPNIVDAGLKKIGIVEGPGTENNPQIIQWAKECKPPLDRTYGRNDSVPWCGLFMAKCATEANYAYPENPLWAMNWQNFGTKVGDGAKLGDVMVWRRYGGGHVNMYIAEDKDYFHCLGGNQHDSVNISRFAKKAGTDTLQLIGVRRCRWRVGPPESVRSYHVEPSGIIGDKVS